MATNEIIRSVQTTLEELKSAEHELNRPKEDVVTLSVCIRIRKALTAMMKLYLMDKGIKYNKNGSLNETLTCCILADKQFENIDLSAINCSNNDESECEGMHCQSTNKVSECIDVANKFKVLLLKKMNIKDNG